MDPGHDLDTKSMLKKNQDLYSVFVDLYTAFSIMNKKELWIIIW